jgi:dipeptidyl-peptidase-3
MANQKPYYIDIEAPIRVVDCEKAFNCLDTREKNYSYYFTRASWEGQKICYFSKSYESPALFYLLMKVFSL